jgi:hypothetical protein
MMEGLSPDEGEQAMRPAIGRDESKAAVLEHDMDRLLTRAWAVAEDAVLACEDDQWTPVIAELIDRGLVVPDARLGFRLTDEGRARARGEHHHDELRVAWLTSGDGAPGNRYWLEVTKGVDSKLRAGVTVDAVTQDGSARLCLRAAKARALAEALIQAADEAEALAQESAATETAARR